MQQPKLYLHNNTQIFEIQTLAMKLTRICRETKIPEHKHRYATRQVRKCLTIIAEEPEEPENERIHKSM